MSKIAEKKVLVVDDDPELFQLIELGLSPKGFKLLHAEYWRDAIRAAYTEHPDIIILDVMMPQMDGFEICRRLREMADFPIIMLTASTSKDDLLTGFRAGADDFITKPFLIDELEARIKALLNRSEKRDSQWTEEFDDGYLKIDLTDGTVSRAGESVSLTPTEFQLLSRLIRNRGSVLSHIELVREVWGTGYLNAENTAGKTSLQLYIGYLRNKIEENPEEPKYIQTKWGVGYWFASETYLDAQFEGDVS